MPLRWPLDDTQREDLYREISKEAFAKASPVESPRHPAFIYVGGEMGSGKSTLLVPQALDEYKGQGGIVLVDTDLIRLRLPYYSELIADPLKRRQATQLTQPDAAYIAERLTREASARRYNVLRVAILQYYPWEYILFLNMLSEVGYQPIEVRVAAASWLTCRLGIFQRYEQEMITTKGKGRFVESAGAEWHHYPATAVTLDMIELEEPFDKRVDRIVVTNRKGLSLYDSVRDGDSKSAKAVFVAERNRSLTHEERLAHIDAWIAVLKSMSNRRAEAWEIESARRLAYADTVRLFDAKEGISLFVELADVYGDLPSLEQFLKEEGIPMPQSSSEQMAREIELGARLVKPARLRQSRHL